MKRCMITITTVLENNTIPTVVVDVSQRGVTVNCPKCPDIEIDSYRRDSHLEIFYRIPDTQEELHFQFKDLYLNSVVE
jgi:hypothetical protein